jgi:hypothetical protein
MATAALPQGEDGLELISDVEDPNANLDPNAEIPEDDGSTPDTPAEIAARSDALRLVAAGAEDAGPLEADDALNSPPSSKPGTGVMIPKQRFDEISQRAKDLEAEREVLLAALRAAKPEPAAIPPEPEPPPFDVKAALKARNAAMIAGEDAKVDELDEKIHDFTLKQATANALAAMQLQQTEQTEAAMKRELDQAAKDVLVLYPQLDPKSGAENEDARIFCVMKRNQMIESGDSWGTALRKASEATAKLFGFKDIGSDPTALPSAKPGSKVLTPELRLVQQRQRNATTQALQPGDTQGVGNRASAPGRHDVKSMTDGQLMSLPRSELDKLDGSA